MWLVFVCDVVSRLHCESESFKMDLILDVNTQIYPVDLGIIVSLSHTLLLSHVKLLFFSGCIDYREAGSLANAFIAASVGLVKCLSSAECGRPLLVNLVIGMTS